MKKIVIVILIVVSFICTVAISSDIKIIDIFKAKTDSNSIIIEWHTKNETNIEKFEIERSTSDNCFTKIGTEKAKGYASNYSYRDTDSFFKNIITSNLLAQTIISYRLKIIYSNSNSPTYTEEIIVTQNMSSVKRTWGMIKEMFK